MARGEGEGGGPVLAGSTGNSVLVVNAGSTSLKLHLVDRQDRAQTVPTLAEVSPGQLEAVAHRVVHGGARFRDTVLIDGVVLAQIREVETIAPLHNAPALAALIEAGRMLPGVPQVAVFDTAFHASLLPEASLYAIPRRWREDWGVRRYGFHGLSVSWAAERAPALLGRPIERLVVCHLGGGSSVTAVREGRSVDTTMGFSPLEGLPMTTRSGSVDPGALLYLLQECGLEAAAAERALHLESGLKALAGREGDMRLLEEAARAGDEDAQLALRVYLHRLAGAVAAMTAALGGLDALVFTAGIGENSVFVREELCRRLVFLGIELDPVRNASATPDQDIARTGSRVRVLIVQAREELVAARAARELLARRGHGVTAP